MGRAAAAGERPRSGAGEAARAPISWLAAAAGGAVGVGEVCRWAFAPATVSSASSAPSTLVCVSVCVRACVRVFSILGCSFLQFPDLVRWSGSINWNRMLINFGKTAQRSSNSPLNGRYRDPYLHAAVSGSVHCAELNYILPQTSSICACAGS